ncbi:MAG: hypothetical protein ACO1O1_04220 [Adhaeribacter sp.]
MTGTRLQAARLPEPPAAPAPAAFLLADNSPFDFVAAIFFQSGSGNFFDLPG